MTRPAATSLSVTKLQLGQLCTLLMDRASIYQTLSTIAPVLNLPQSIVVGFAANIQPIGQLLLLGDLGVDAIAISECEHNSSLPYLLANITPIKYKAALERRGFQPIFSVN
jgi:hypothetical protein